MKFPQYGRVPSELLKDPNISAGAIRLFALLDDYADRDSGVCWPSIEALMDGMGVSRPTINRALTELIENGWVERQERFSGSRQTSNTYIVHGTRRGITSDTLPPITSDTQNKNQKEPKQSSIKRSKQKKKNTELKPMDEARFEAWWKGYPRKVGKAKARTAWVPFIASGKTEDLTTALANYNASITAGEVEAKYIMHATTFLNGRWEDFVDGVNTGAWEGSEDDDEWTEW